MQVGDAPVGVDHRQARARLVVGVDSRLDGLAPLGRQALDRREYGGQTVIGIGAYGREVVGEFGEDVGEVGAYDMAEHDRVGDLHHRGLQVHREEHTLLLGLRHLLGEKGHERLLAHDSRVDDLARQHLDRGLEDGHRAVSSDVLDAQIVSLLEGDRTLGVAEVAVVHRRDVRLGLRGPMHPSSGGATWRTP